MLNFDKLIQARPTVAANLRKDFGAFCRAAWPHLHRGRGKQLSWTWAHDLIAEYMKTLWSGTITRLIINCPPRFAKSSIVTILFPIWCWLHDPALAFLCASYEIDLSTNHNADRRRLMETEWFKSLFADRFQLAVDRAQAGEFGNVQGGVMMAASVNSKAMGRGGDFILLDDILSADQAYSDAQRGEVLDWLQHMMPQRLNNPATSKIVLVMQRLHQSDPTGDLLEREQGEWTLLKLPLIAEEDETWKFPVSGRVVVRKAGECLDPVRWTPKEVRKLQKNRLVFAGQYQQEPAPLEGNIIRAADIVFHSGKDPVTGARDADLPTDFDLKVISADCSFKDIKSSDFVGIVVVGVKGPRRYLLNVVNARLDLDATETEILRQHALYGPIQATLVEDAANGTAVISHLREKISGLIPRSAQGGKMARMIATSPSFQARNWFLDRTASFTNELVNQLTMFPTARFDDLSDALSQCEVWIQEGSSAFGLLDWAQGVAAGVYDAFKVALSRKPKPAAVVVPPAAPVGFCCGSFARQLLPGGGVRCANCGRQSNRPIVPADEPCSCDSILHIRIAGNMMHCNGCSRQWYPEGVNPRPPYRPSRKDLPHSSWMN